MVIVQTKALLKRLTRSMVSALEKAVGRCVEARHYEVTVEHLLLALLDDPDADVSAIVRSCDLDAAAIRSALERGLADLRDGNSGRPTFSPILLEWLQDAWLVASLEHGWTKVRSGAAFARFVAQPTKYSAPGVGALLEACKPRIPDELASIVDGSSEDAECGAAPGGASQGPGGRSTAPPPPEPRDVVLYRVAAGDTLASLAREFLVDVEEVARSNGLALALALDAALPPGTFVRLRVLRSLTTQAVKPASN